MSATHAVSASSTLPGGRTEAQRRALRLRGDVNDRHGRAGVEQRQQPRHNRIRRHCAICVQLGRHPHAQRLRHARAGRHQRGHVEPAIARPLLQTPPALASAPSAHRARRSVRLPASALLAPPPGARRAPPAGAAATAPGRRGSSAAGQRPCLLHALWRWRLPLRRPPPRHCRSASPAARRHPRRRPPPRPPTSCAAPPAAAPAPAAASLRAPASRPQPHRRRQARLT
jgi:hypothetical protein